MHVTGVFLLDPAGAPGGFSFDQVRAMVARRLHRAPPFRRRLVEVPFRLAHPLWIEDPDFDLDYHVRRACLPSPGGLAELESFVGQIVGLPLDRQRPLWEMYLVEGLEGGRQAIVMKMHHAAIDGVSGAELTATWLDLEADPPPDADGVDDWHPERVPSEIDLLVGAWAQLAVEPDQGGENGPAFHGDRAPCLRAQPRLGGPASAVAFQRTEDVVQPVDHAAPAGRVRRSGAR